MLGLPSRFFRYTEYGEPYIWVALKGKDGNPFNYRALIDSGADVSIAPIEIALLTGVLLDKKTIFGKGICGRDCSELSNFSEKVVMDIVGKPFQCSMNSFPADNPTKFIILGRQDLLEKHRVIFDKEGVAITSYD